jgi:hypothetical protein
LFAQYRFGDAKAAFRPYLGAGLTYAYFYDENATNTLNALSGGTPSNPTTFSIESKFALSVQAGATYSFNERWFLDGVVGYTRLKNTTTLSTGQTQPMTLNPVSWPRRLPVLDLGVRARRTLKKPTSGRFGWLRSALITTIPQLVVATGAERAPLA